MPEIIQYWIDEFTEEFPDLPLNILRIEWEDALGAASNEKTWALGSDNEEEAIMHHVNAELQLDYANWLNDKAIELYGEALAC